MADKPAGAEDSAPCRGNPGTRDPAAFRFAFAAASGGPYLLASNQRTFPPAMIKAVVKTIALLAILFVMLYVGMNNTHAVDFHFPLAGTTAKQPLHASAALIYFGMFAVGLLAGTILAVGGGAAKGKPSKSK